MGVRRKRGWGYRKSKYRGEMDRRRLTVSLICIIINNTNKTRRAAMIIRLDMASEVPIYVQLRNAVVVGIGKGELQPSYICYQCL